MPRPVVPAAGIPAAPLAALPACAFALVGGCAPWLHCAALASPNPNLQPGVWSEAEDQLLALWQGRVGNKWSEVAKHIPVSPA